MVRISAARRCATRSTVFSTGWGRDVEADTLVLIIFGLMVLAAAAIALAGFAIVLIYCWIERDK